MLLKQNTHLHSSICIFYKEVPHVRTWFSIVVAPSANKTLQKIKTKWKYRENWIYLSNFIDREAYLFELVIISGNLNMSKVPGPQVTMLCNWDPDTVRVVRWSQFRPHQHWNPKLRYHVFHLLGDVLSLGFELLYACLVCEEDHSIALGVQVPQLLGDTVVPPLPVTGPCLQCT